LNVVRDSFQMFCEVLKIRYHILFGVYNHPTPGYQIVTQTSVSSVSSDSLETATSKLVA
jgi:hypothetical protein